MGLITRPNHIQLLVPLLVASLEPLAHHRNVASLSLFYSYYFAELGELVSLPHSFVNSTRYSNKLLDLYVIFLSCNKDFYVNSFFPCKTRLRNSLPAVCFCLIYHINGFKCRVNRQGSLYSFFYDFHLFLFLVTPSLVVAVQPCMAWNSILKNWLAIKLVMSSRIVVLD